MLGETEKYLELTRKSKENVLLVKLLRKMQKNIEEEFKINELWHSYDKRRIGMKRIRRVWLRNEVIDMKD